MMVLLIAPVDFLCPTGQVIIAQGTEIYVDLDKMIGYYDGHHFMVFPDEFVPIN
jgi:hypothetical protein